jgi:hypothetical protein
VSVRRAAVLATTLALVIASVSFGLGTYTAHRLSAWRSQESEAKINALRSEMIRTLRGIHTGAAGTAGTMGVGEEVPGEVSERAAFVAAIKRELQDEMGLVPVRLMRDRRSSFVEMYTQDSYGASSYGTAGYLGNGHFITVKHGVVALGRDEQERREPRRIVSIKLVWGQRTVPAAVVDAGSATTEVDPGDWAILRVREEVDLPALRVDLDYDFEFADPIFRLGNDYSKGIILSAGYVGQKTQNQLVTCLTDGHPGVSGGGVLDQKGDLVGIPVGRMQGDYRFSFILPLRAEMFRKVTGAPQLSPAPSGEEGLTQASDF